MKQLKRPVTVRDNQHAWELYARASQRAGKLYERARRAKMVTVDREGLERVVAHANLTPDFALRPLLFNLAEVVRLRQKLTMVPDVYVKGVLDGIGQRFNLNIADTWQRLRICPCGKLFVALTGRALYHDRDCSNRLRQKAFYDRKADEAKHQRAEYEVNRILNESRRQPRAKRVPAQ